MNPATLDRSSFTVRQGATAVDGEVRPSGSSATFSPSAALAADTVYTATITVAARDLAGTPLATPHSWTFTTEATADTTAPTVISTVPASGAANAPVNGTVAATFSEAMNPATLDQVTFTVRQGTTAIPGVVTPLGTAVTFSASSPFAASTTYTATISTGAEDLAGNPLGAAHTWDFTTGATPDTTAPTVIATVPATDARNVAVNGRVSATFSEAMDPASLNLTTFTLEQGGSAVPGAVRPLGATVTFEPSSPLAVNTLYTAVISTGARDLAGNPLAASYTWDFTTGPTPDTTAPFVVSTIPGRGAVNVPVNAVVSVNFSEAMDPASLNLTTFTLRQGSTAVPGAVNPQGAAATFDPSSPLTAATTYTATIATGARDVAGNRLSTPYTWTFTTGATADTTAPIVISTVPRSDATNVPVNGLISAVFSEPMNPASLNQMTFTLKQGATAVPGTVTSLGAPVTFDPSSPLTAGTTYTATISTGARDLAGNALVADHTWSFTTGSAPDATAPIVLFTVPARDALNVPVNSAISVTFSKVMNPASLNMSTVTLKQGTTSVAGSVTPLGATVIFTPSGPLTANTTYTATIGAGARDIAGNPLAGPYSWDFTTGTGVDTTAPMVFSTVAVRDAVNVPVNDAISVTFSEVMDPATMNVTTFTLKRGTTPVTGVVRPLGTPVTFTPTSPLIGNTVYTVSIGTGARDLAGNPLAAIYTWSFTTGTGPNRAAPTVVYTVPGRAAIGAPVNGALSATFSKDMDPATLNVTTFTLEEGTTPVLGLVSPLRDTVTFTPSSPLRPSTTYTATITRGAEDIGGNALAALYTWSFTTGATADTTAPRVLSTRPDPGALNVPLRTRLTARFSEPMDPITINPLSFTLKQGTMLIPGTVGYDAVTWTATFTPDQALAPDTIYEASITTTAEDLAGNPLALDHRWTFSTAACGQAPVVMGAAGSFVVLAGSTVTSTGPTSVTGNLGVSPGTAVTGFPPGIIVGNLHAGDPSAALGLFDLTTAYNDARGRTLCPVTVSGNLGGMTLRPGLYKSTSSLEISSGDLTLDAQGDGDAVFIFQMASTLTTTPGRQVILIGGARAANVFWQVGSSATLGTTSVFAGTIMADQAVTMGTGARLVGRVLARIAAVSLDENVIVPPSP
jgi:hypothetical protein